MRSARPVLATAKRGDGHPVLVLPGFMSDDRVTAPLRKFLRRKGYGMHGWRLGRNVGAHPHVLEGLERRLTELGERDGRKVSLIGWSLGGLYARELGRSHPDLVRSVITLASPFRFREGDRGHLSRLYERLAPRDERFIGTIDREQDRPPMPVPATSIYTRSDGLVRWHACIDAQAASCENIEVRGTHSGLGFNVAALYAIADRLAQPEGAWSPFKPPVGLRALYPRPVWWHEVS